MDEILKIFWFKILSFFLTLPIRLLFCSAHVKTSFVPWRSHKNASRSVVLFRKRWFLISSVWVERRFSGTVEIFSKTGISKKIPEKFWGNFWRYVIFWLYW